MRLQSSSWQKCGFRRGNSPVDGSNEAIGEVTIQWLAEMGL